VHWQRQSPAVPPVTPHGPRHPRRQTRRTAPDDQWPLCRDSDSLWRITQQFTEPHRHAGDVGQYVECGRPACRRRRADQLRGRAATTFKGLIFFCCANGGDAGQQLLNDRRRSGDPWQRDADDDGDHAVLRPRTAKPLRWNRISALFCPQGLRRLFDMAPPKSPCFLRPSLVRGAPEIGRISLDRQAINNCTGTILRIR
jgi:hypothetical protein